jgi:GT2 family glycosyltransferase
LNQPIPAWTLITVAYNSERALREFWTPPTTTDIEWLVVDNASADGSASLAKSLGARVIRLPANRGFGAANNIGFAASTGEYVAFVNPDVSAQLADLPMLSAHLDRYANALVSPQLINADGSLQPNGRGLPYLANKIRNRIRPGTLTGDYLHYAHSGETVEVAWLMGAVVAGRRSHLASLGPWDEKFFVYYEDSDLGLRNTRAGGTNVVLGDAQWLHGWARETKKASLPAWKRELPSMAKFYGRYPRLLGRPRPLVRGVCV